MQKHGLLRGDIVLESGSDDNSACNSGSGAELGTEFEENNEDEAALNGRVKATISLEDEDLTEDVEVALHEFGASDILQE